MKPKIENPLDNLFDVMPFDGDNEAEEYEQITEGELAELRADQEIPTATDTIDAEDIEVNRKIDEVYEQALGTFQQQMAYTEVIEPRYAARNAEVAASYLNIALNAATARGKLKNERKRQQAFIPHAGKVTNNTIVATREEIMRMISVDADTKEI